MSTTKTTNNVTIKTNKEKKGIELLFDSKPDNKTLEALKANSWRWSRYNGVWYNRDTKENLEFAKSLKPKKATTTTKATTKTTTKAKTTEQKDREKYIKDLEKQLKALQKQIDNLYITIDKLA